MKHILVFSLLIIFIFSFSLLAQSQRGLRVVTKDPETDKELQVYNDTWAVVIGINNYTYWPKLRYATKDAESIADLLVNKYGFQKNHIILIRDQEAKWQGIKGALGTLIDKTGNQRRC